MDKSSDKSDSRPRRDATQVTDFRKYHTTGSTGKTPPPGKVAAAVQRLETPDKEQPSPAKKHTTSKAKRALSGDTQSTQPPASSTCPPVIEMSELEQLKAELKKQKEHNASMEAEMEIMKVKAELQAEKMKEQEWKVARDRLEQEQAAAAAQHEEVLKAMKEAKTEEPDENPAVKFLKQKLAELHGGHTPPKGPVTPDPTPSEDTKQKEVADQLKQLVDKRQELATAAAEAAKGCPSNPEIQDLLAKLRAVENDISAPKTEEQDEQTKLMAHLLDTLQGKETASRITKQKEILRHFLTESNKTITTGGATTLKPDLLKKLSGESDTFNMAEWLANFNKHRLEDCQPDSTGEECKHAIKKSGMLDKATTNIQHKEVWPQKNLLEDWADEDMEFKHMQFEHFVAGEVRTVETTTDPAQILGRLRLLRRMAYAKLRGYEWPVIRKMYAAILRSIETKENTWDTNFDRYETILYRRPPQRREERTGPHNSNSGGKKWFCRDWNKGTCQKSAPHNHGLVQAQMPPRGQSYTCVQSAT